MVDTNHLKINMGTCTNPPKPLNGALNHDYILPKLMLSTPNVHILAQSAHLVTFFLNLCKDCKYATKFTRNANCFSTWKGKGRQNKRGQKFGTSRNKLIWKLYKTMKYNYLQTQINLTAALKSFMVLYKHAILGISWL